MEIKYKIQKVREQSISTSRCINTIFDEIEKDHTITDEQLYRLVKNVYNTGKHRAPSYVKRNFTTSMRWLKTEITKLNG